ncbi:FAD synthase [Metamycoplasma gateae]|uniref:FAD synthase n=1 Tax=Metamycoplasma gateae TaxID=35769 RepID=A0ABZ2AI22_9BACT|nr:riboflavin biosynthesis protein [Metamycoplasma gateae]
MKIFNWNFKEKFDHNEDLIMLLGSFETLHLGHYELVKTAKDIRNTNPELKLAIMLFSQSYKSLVAKEEKVFQIKTRLYTLFNLGFDYVFLVDDNINNFNVSHEQFCKNLLENKVKKVVCGNDFKFGFRKIGNIDYLKKYFQVYVSNDRKIQKQKISTSLIKDLIEDGNISAINNLLIEKYSFITNLEKMNFFYPNNIKKIRSGIYVSNFVIDDVEYHGLIKINHKSNKEKTNQAYIFDLELIPSKYKEVFVEVEALIRHINFQHEDKIEISDIETAKKWFIKK